MFSSQASLAGQKVLLAEDQVALADDLQESLQRRGATVVGPAYSVGGAFRLLSESFDLAILDLKLNGESILPFADTLKARGVPFFLSSAHGADLPPSVYRSVPLWVKPFDLEALLDDVALHQQLPLTSGAPRSAPLGRA